MVKLTHQPIMMMNGVLIQTQAGLFASLCVFSTSQKTFRKEGHPLNQLHKHFESVL